jgi:membrane protein
MLIAARKVSFPGFGGIPLYDVMLFFYRSMVDGTLTLRASAIAYSLFVALFPAIIFLFTLIPYIPVRDFQSQLLELIHHFLPASTLSAVEGTLEDILTRPRGGLLSLGFLMALIFATNGLVTMMSAFDTSLNTSVRRTWLDQRIVSIGLLFLLVLLLAAAMALFMAGQMAIDYLFPRNLAGNILTYYMLIIGKWIVILALLFFAYSSLYFFAPAKKTRWRFISPGSTMSTVLSLAVLGGFRYYIAHFGQYNKLYGSIGTLLVILLLFYLMSLILLIGFELNNSLNAANRRIPHRRRKPRHQHKRQHKPSHSIRPPKSGQL